MPDKLETSPFIQYLKSLAERENRGALAALRRGLGQPPGTVAAMYPYVVPWLPADARQEAAYYLVAALLALHPATGGNGSLGTAFKRAQGSESNEAIERRFTALLAAHPEDLPDHLRQAVGFLKSKEVAVDWNQLFYDVQHWGHPAHMVQKAWARAYWGSERHEQPEEKEN